MSINFTNNKLTRVKMINPLPKNLEQYVDWSQNPPKILWDLIRDWGERGEMLKYTSAYQETKEKEVTEVNELVEVLNYEGNEVRKVVKDGKIWFVAKDICDCLEHSNHKMVVGRLDDDEKGVNIVHTKGGPQEMLVVNESGIYHLIFISRMERAKEFRRWVTNEVLPTIRTTNSYGVNEETNRLKARIEHLEHELNHQTKLLLNAPSTRNEQSKLSINLLSQAFRSYATNEDVRKSVGKYASGFLRYELTQSSGDAYIQTNDVFISLLLRSVFKYEFSPKEIERFMLSSVFPDGSDDTHGYLRKRERVRGYEWMTLLGFNEKQIEKGIDVRGYMVPETYFKHRLMIDDVELS